MWLWTDNFTRLLLKYPEHTWGSAGYVNGEIDVDKWANDQFHQAVAHPSTPLQRSHQHSLAGWLAGTDGRGQLGDLQDCEDQ